MRRARARGGTVSGIRSVRNVSLEAAGLVHFVLSNVTIRGDLIVQRVRKAIEIKIYPNDSG